MADDPYAVTADTGGELFGEAVDEESLVTVLRCICTDIANG